MAKKELAETNGGELAAYEGFEDFSGEGFAEVTSEDLAIPFLRVLAQLSPQVNKRDAAYVQGAEAGQMFNTVLNEHMMVNRVFLLFLVTITVGL